MAFAIASGVKPEQGIYTAIIAGIVVSLFDGSRIQIAGPTGVFVVIQTGVTAQHGGGSAEDMKDGKDQARLGRAN